MELALLSASSRPVSATSSTPAKQEVSPTAVEHFSPTTTGDGARELNSGAIPFRLGKDLGKGLLRLENSPITDVNHRKVLYANETDKPYLPGQPRIKLLSNATPVTGGRNTTEYQLKLDDDLRDYLKKCHLTKELDGLVGWWMKYIFVQTPSHKHITSLSHQEARSRKIIVDEHPGLHLVWYYETIFVKPIPAYFYSQAFWDYLHNAEEKVHAAAVGFMRSWYYLIQYETDYEKAVQLKLIPNKPSAVDTPTEAKPPTYAEFCDFIAPFASAPDTAVNPRYTYGELRMTRLNKTAFFEKFELAYFHTHPQWGSFLGTVMGPIFTVFVILSVVLNSMQVTLTAIGGIDEMDPRWKPYVSASAWFPVVVICMIAAVIGVAVGGLTIMSIKDFYRTKKLKSKKRKGEADAGEKSHGMIW